MATSVPPRAPTPRLKAPPSAASSAARAAALPTSSSLSASTAASDNVDHTHIPNPRSPAPPATRRMGKPASTEYLSDRATAAFIRRVLCSQHLAERGRSTPSPIEDLLPPLTSRNDVDLQLYALLAVILREFVQAWYSKITPDDAFVAEIVQIIAHCTRALEQRIRKVDLESLLFDEIPELLERHIQAYRTAHHPAARPPTHVDPRTVYHSLNPLAPMSPVPHTTDPASIEKQKEHEALYRQLLVQGVLTVLLPTEDLENECLTALVEQIFSELIIGNLIANKLSQPWLLLECFIIIARNLDKRKDSSDAQAATTRTDEKSTSTTSERSSEMQRLGTPTSSRKTWTIQGVFWSCLHWLFLICTSIKICVSTLASSSSLPTRLDISHNSKHSTASPTSPAKENSPAILTPAKAPLIDFKLWSCASRLIQLDDRMPWLSGMLCLLQVGATRGPGQFGGLDGPLDRLLSHTIHTRLLDPSHLPRLLRTVRGALFPNNAPGVSTLVTPASDAELAALRRRCARSLSSLMPQWLLKLYFGGRGLNLTTSSPSTNSTKQNRTDSLGNSPSSSLTKSPDGSGAKEQAVADDSKHGNDQNTGSAADQYTRGRVLEGEAAQQNRGPSRGAPESGGSGGLTLGPSGSGGGGPGAARGEDKDEVGNGPVRRANSSTSISSSVNSSTLRPMATTAGGRSSSTAARQNGSHDNTGGGHSTAGDVDNTTQIFGSDEGKKTQNGQVDHSSAIDEDDEQVLTEIEEGILDVFSDEYCNKHLMYGLVELILVRLMPELAQRGIAELWAERLS